MAILRLALVGLLPVLLHLNFRFLKALKLGHSGGCTLELRLNLVLMVETLIGRSFMFIFILSFIFLYLTSCCVHGVDKHLRDADVNYETDDKAYDLAVSALHTSNRVANSKSAKAKAA
jgi:hypothetical protein